MLPAVFLTLKSSKQMAWIKVEDRLPVPQEPVLTFKRGDGSWIQWVDQHEAWQNGTDPTHWMPLPDSPVVSSHGG